MVKKKMFQASQFVATEFHTAQQKAEFADRLANFLLNGCPAGQFTKILYDRLNKAWGHIAHYDIRGFYDVWFSTPAKRVEFVKHTIENGYRAGDPKFTFSDVEKAVADWLKASNLLLRFQHEADSEQHYTSIEDVARALLRVNKNQDGELVRSRVLLARLEVERGLVDNVRLDDNRVAGIVVKLTREFCQEQEVFILAAVSENTNSFGLHQHIFIARSGEAWACHASRCSGRNLIQVHEKVTVKLVAGVPDWTSLGYEVPERVKNPPPDLLKQLWE